MNEKLKSIFSCIGLFFSGLFSTLFFVLLHNRRTTDGTRESVQSAEESNRAVESAINDATDTSDRLAESIESSKATVDKLSESVGTSGNIFEEIRKQKLDD